MDLAGPSQSPEAAPSAPPRVQVGSKDFADHRLPSRCDLRIFLREQGVPVAPPSPFDEMIRRLGSRHEVGELTRLQPVVNLGAGAPEQRAQAMREAIADGAPVIYKGLLALDTELGGVPVTVSATPDFLIAGPAGYTIRESRLAGASGRAPRPEVALGLQLAGWLLRETLEHEPVALEVGTQSGAVVTIDDDGGERARVLLADLARLKNRVNDFGPPPYEPVNWFKCHACSFVRYCWARAVDRLDAACVPAIDESLARALHERGVDTAAQLVKTFDVDQLAALERQTESGAQPLGAEAADVVLRATRAFASGHEEVLAAPDLPLSDNYVAFDCEGLPPQFDELDRVYVWGVQVFGTLPSPYTAAMATAGADGDRAGWLGFLAEVGALFGYYGDIPFVHWLDDEPTAVARYVERFGDPDGVAARVQRNLVDIERVMRGSIVLPLASNSLKSVSRFCGSRRELDQHGRDWSLAKYIETVETADEFQRGGLVGQVQANNREDLEATYIVLKWLLARAADGQAQ
jgi:predicted RecB family nuclease